MKRQTVVTIKITWDDAVSDSPETWDWGLIEGLSDDGLAVELIPHPSNGDVEVEAVDIDRFDDLYLISER